MWSGRVGRRWPSGPCLRAGSRGLGGGGRRGLGRGLLVRLRRGSGSRALSIALVGLFDGFWRRRHWGKARDRLTRRLGRARQRGRAGRFPAGGRGTQLIGQFEFGQVAQALGWRRRLLLRWRRWLGGTSGGRRRLPGRLRLRPPVGSVRAGVKRAIGRLAGTMPRCRRLRGPGISGGRLLGPLFFRRGRRLTLCHGRRFFLRHRRWWRCSRLRRGRRWR